MNEKILKTKINYTDGGLFKGFYYEEEKIAIFGSEEIFGKAPKKKGKRKPEALPRVIFLGCPNNFEPLFILDTLAQSIYKTSYIVCAIPG